MSVGFRPERWLDIEEQPGDTLAACPPAVSLDYERANKIVDNLLPEPESGDDPYTIARLCARNVISTYAVLILAQGEEGVDTPASFIPAAADEVRGLYRRAHPRARLSIRGAEIDRRNAQVETGVRVGGTALGAQISMERLLGRSPSKR